MSGRQYFPLLPFLSVQTVVAGAQQDVLEVDIKPLLWAGVIVRCQVSVYGQCISAACRVIPDIRRSCKCMARTINL